MTRAYQLMISRFFAFGLLCILLLGTAGCGKKGTLSGKVTYNGKALPVGTTLTFIGKTNRAFSTEVKTEDGAYKIEGLPVDEYKVTVKVHTSSAPIGGVGPMGGKPGAKKDKGQMGPSEGQTDVTKPPEGFFNAMQGGSGQGGGFQIPTRYQDQESTTVSVTVKGGPQDFPITLTD